MEFKISIEMSVIFLLRITYIAVENHYSFFFFPYHCGVAKRKLNTANVTQGMWHISYAESYKAKEGLSKRKLPSTRK